MAFEGRNNLPSTAWLMHERIKYQLEAFPENNGMGPRMVKNTNYAEINYYGFVDREGASIYPKEEKLSDLDGANTAGSEMAAKRALSIVADMHREVKTNIEFNVMWGKLFPSVRSIASMVPRIAYSSPVLEYEAYLSSIFIKFNNQALSLYGKENVTDYKSYVKYFMKFISENYWGMPISFSSWIRSRHNSIYSTGLAVGIVDQPFDIDKNKQKFINSGNLFEYYKKLVMNKGFAIMHNAPWCLIADLASPAMIPFYQANNVYDVDGFLFQNFDYARKRDLNLIIFNTKSFYNKFVVLNEYYIKYNYKCNKSSSKTFFYEPVEGIIASDTSPAWIEIYADIRNIEEKTPYNYNQLRTIKMKAMKKYQTDFFLDRQVAIDYIDNRFSRLLFQKPFGHNHITRRNKLAKQAKLNKKLSKSLGGAVSSGMPGSSKGGSSGGY